MKLASSFLALCMLASSGLYADEAPLAQEGGGISQTFIMVGLLLVFFYFILWRPEQKRRKAMEKQRSGLRKGDRVTAMGIVGTVAKIEEKTLILKMYDGSKIEMLKAAINEVVPAANEEDESSSSKDKDE